MPRGLSAFTERQKEHTRQQRQRTRQSAGIVENRKRLWKAVWMRPSLCKILNRKMLTVNTVSAATGTLLPYRRPYGTLAASPSGAGRLSLECSGLPVIRQTSLIRRFVKTDCTNDDFPPICRTLLPPVSTWQVVMLDLARLANYPQGISCHGR